MSVRFVVPKLRLAKLLRMPGGLPVVEAVEAAERNLQVIRPTCQVELMALLELCEQGFATLGAEFDDAGLKTIYAIAVRGIGGGQVCGLPGVDTCLISLCDLIDHLRTTRRYDRKAVGVHVSSWRLLMGADLPKAGATAVLDGLRKVNLRYAEDIPAAEA
jgi:hypothetical protein